MNTKVKVVSNCKREIDIEVPKEAVSAKFDEVFTEMEKHSKIKGFRSGKAPRKMVEQHYSDFVTKEVIKDLIPEYYQKAVEKEKLAPAGYPEVSDVQLKDKILTFKAILDIRPEVDLKNYKGIKVNKSKVEVKDEEITKTLESIHKTHLESLQQNQSKDEAAKVEEKPSELNDEFAKKIGFKDLSGLKEKIKDQLLAISEAKASQEEQAQIVKHLLSSSKFEVPASWVEKQYSYLLNNAKINLLRSGVKAPEVDAKLKDKEKEIQEQADANVRLFFILEKIAKTENLKVSEDDIDLRVKNIAASQGVELNQMRDYLQQKGLLDDLVSEIMHAKVMDFLIQESLKV